MCVYYVEIMYAGRIRLGWAHDIFIVACHMFMHFSCIRTILFLLIDIVFGNLLLVSLSLSLSLSLSVICSWHQRRTSLLHPGTLFILGHLLLILLLLLFGFVMIKPFGTFWRTFHGVEIIQNAKSYFQTFLILTFLLSSIVGVGSPFVTSRSPFPP